jgi:hypothetical protein
MNCEGRAVGTQPLSETNRNGTATLKWISGKCAVRVLTKFRFCYETSLPQFMYCEQMALRRNSEHS